MNRKQKIIFPAVMLALISGQSLAAAQDDARQHFQAIATGNMSKIMQQYAENAHLEWVGGPLNGTYSSPDAIKNVWNKFTTAQGTLKYTVTGMSEAANHEGTTISAKVLFEGKKPIKVFYVLTYRGEKIVNETWQIAPAMTLATTN